MKNVFDITEFGAVSDGATDCTAAIQSALDRAGECCGVVAVPPGRYRTGRLQMRARTRIEGYSAWSFRSDGLSVLELADENAVCLLDITGAFGCSVSGLCLDGRRLGRSVHGVYLYWEKYNGGGEEDTPTIDDCRIGNFTGDGAHLEHVWCFSVRHSMLHRNGGAGMYIDGWDAFIIDNWLTANAYCGMLGGPCAASITATGNRIEWNRVAGVWLRGGSCVNFTGNYFDRSFGPALRLGAPDGGFSDASASGNVFYRSGCPDGMNFACDDEKSHILLEHARNAAISGNVFRTGVNDDGGGTRSPDYAIVMRSCENVELSGNATAGGFMVKEIVTTG
jgi:hypothetical protein